MDLSRLVKRCVERPLRWLTDPVARMQAHRPESGVQRGDPGLRSASFAPSGLRWLFEAGVLVSRLLLRQRSAAAHSTAIDPYDNKQV